MSLMTLPRRSIWPAPSRRSIWPGRYGAGPNVQSIDNLIASLSGALYSPDTSNCWRDAGRTTPCTYDTKVYLMDDTTGAFTASQPTSTSQPYLRSGNYSDLPFTSDTGETWTTTRTMIDAAGGIEWDGADAYWRNSAGITGNYISTPDSVAASITGNGVWIFDGALVDWTPGTISVPISKISGTTGEYGLSVLTDGTLLLTWYVAGVAKTATSTAAIGATDASGCAIKVVREIGVKVQFYKATDFNRATRTGTWVQIGSDVVNTDAAATDTANSIFIGAQTISALPISGKIYYAAAWANTTGSGTPAWEFYPSRDAVKPASPWLDFDGTNDYLISSIIPGNYSAGFVCAGAVQTEAIGSGNALFGSSSSLGVVKGVRIVITVTGEGRIVRSGASSAVSTTTVNKITVNAPFIEAGIYSTSGSSVQINSSAVASDVTAMTYTGSTQYSLIGATNDTESGISPANYLQGHIHAIAWLPVIPTEAQETAIRSYIASKAGVTL